MPFSQRTYTHGGDGPISPTSPGLWPHEAPRYTESEAERKVYNALKSSLPEGWYAWHSLKLRVKRNGEFAEADFLLADPKRPSILVLEVKGGKVEQHDGRWYQNSEPLNSSPLLQAFSFRKKLVMRLREEGVALPTIGVAACFPDTFFDRQPTQDDLRGLVIGAQDHPYLDQILQRVMESAVPEPWPVKGPWVNALHEFWGETWEPKLCLSTMAHGLRDVQNR